MPVVGGVFEKLAGFLGKKSSEITDSGLVISGAVRDLAAGRGVQQYADVTTKSSSFFGLGKKTNLDTLTGNVDDQLARQFGLIFTNVGDALKVAAGSFGQDTAKISAQVAGFIVDLPKVSLRGLNGSDLQDAISSVVSSAADQITSAVIPGLDDFQQIGEGAFQTAVRVANGIEEAQYALEKFGLAAVDFRAITEKSADVAAEIVRESILGTEVRDQRKNTSGTASFDPLAGTLTGVGRIIEGFAGSADELSDTYEALLNVRSVMRSVGETGIDLSQAMLRGAGGLDSLKSGLDAYFDRFFNDNEKTAASTARLAEEFGRIGVVLPDSNASFRALVEGIDTSGEAGQKLYGQVISLSGAFAKLYPLADATASASKSLADAWRSITDSLTAEVRRIRGLLGQTGGQNYAALAASFATSTAAARAGDQDAAKALPGISQAMLEAAKAVSSTSEQFRVYQASAAASLETTAGLIAMWASAQTAPTVSSQPTPVQPVPVVVQAPIIPTVPVFALDPVVAKLEAMRLELANLTEQNARLEARLETMAADQRTGFATLSNNTSRSAKAAERVLSEDGNAVVVTSRSDATVVTVS